MSYVIIRDENDEIKNAFCSLKNAFCSDLAFKIEEELSRGHYIKEEERDANYDYFDEMIRDALEDYILIKKK